MFVETLGVHALRSVYTWLSPFLGEKPWHIHLVHVNCSPFYESLVVCCVNKAALV